jgi:hypothetical protein
MIREVGRFLLETWQLFYWSLFLPSKLQQRMNEWSPKKTEEGASKDTFAKDILLLQYDPRFVIQYFFILIAMGLPIADLVSSSAQGWHWLFFLISLVTSYILGLWFLPSGIGFCNPLLLALVCSEQADVFAKMLQNLHQFLPYLPQSLSLYPHLTPFILGVCVVNIFISIIIFISWIFHSDFFWIGSGLSVLLGSWIASQNWWITLSLAIYASWIANGLLKTPVEDPGIKSFAGTVFGTVNAHVVVVLMLPLLRDMVLSVRKDEVLDATGIFAIIFISVAWLFPVLAIGFSVRFTVKLLVENMSDILMLVVGVFSAILMLAVSIVVGTSVLGTVIGVIVIMRDSSSVQNVTVLLPWFLTVCALVTFSLAPLKHWWLGLVVASIFVVLGWEKLSFNTLLTIPVSLMGYYRILPDYFLSYLISLVVMSPFQKRSSLNSVGILTKLPPYTTELLWFSLPNHAQILADTFHQNNTALLGLRTFQKMQDSSLPGFQSTLQKALPSIVAIRFVAVETTTELINSVEKTYPFLPIIIPTFYQSGESVESLVLPKSENSEIGILFPRLKQIAKDTAAALEGGSAALRERGLERLVEQLKKLPDQLPGLGLKPRAVKRWQPAIERWQHILELEIAEQQKTSQGELLNPFQFGNPLRTDRDKLFKGRQDFTDRLVRLILDRNRPTLVLHGPRRSGKTSFLLNLPRLLPSDLVPIYLDMQQGSMTASEGDFCYGFVRAIDRDTRSQGLQLPPIPIREAFYARPYPTLEDWLDLALPKLGERRLLLNLDEFEKIGSAIKDNRMSERLFDQLRSMIQHYDRLGFLFSGVQTLEELGPRWSNYFISVVPMEMHYLEPHEAEDLLLHPDPEFTLQYDTGIVAEILRLTRCQPYLLQLIGSAIVNQANLQHTQLATTTLLQAAIQSAFTNGEPYFTNIWTEFTGTTPTEVTAGQQILIALAQGNSHVETSDEATTAARRRLLRYHVIERDGDIDKIEIPLFEQWVRERAIET